jgi:hypothetical protein
MDFGASGEAVCGGGGATSAISVELSAVRCIRFGPVFRKKLRAGPKVPQQSDL